MTCQETEKKNERHSLYFSIFIFHSSRIFDPHVWFVMNAPASSAARLAGSSKYRGKVNQNEINSVLFNFFTLACGESQNVLRSSLWLLERGENGL